MIGHVATPKQPIDKPYSIASTKACIPTPFDPEKLNYNSWSALFKRFCKTYNVQHHLEAPSTASSTAPVDAHHDRNDSLVVIWIYSTIYPKLVDMRDMQHELLKPLSIYQEQSRPPCQSRLQGK
ncbi:hypothetical protein CTI12_AA553080 [Artemisia annua]|uniref:Uncharacterized protein n=1 Tax=Artemisia annua TaxID=35608 RepID=A0A2U1KXD7_ARTAN|nr:hypothetical protein CTI12_AA553080 [Artemisia annua]